MRAPLFEKLKQKELSYINELNKIYNLIYDDNSAKICLHESFKKSYFNIFFENYDKAVLYLFETNRNYGLHSNDLRTLIHNIINLNGELTLDSFLDYLELYKTLFSLNRSYISNNIEQIKQIIEYDCNKLGYFFLKDEETNAFKVILKNPEAESVALSVNKSTRDKIYEYLSIRCGNIEEKRKCIKSLADDVEITLNQYSNIKEYGKLKQFIQCVRHTKDNPKKEFPFYYDNEETWLDNIFEMIIGILSFTKTKEIISNIIELENSSNNNVSL